jgi:quercetin dioxygenase-like cupin family protein
MEVAVSDKPEASVPQASVNVFRTYADDQGKSRFDSYSVAQRLQQFAPPADPVFVSAREPASGYVLIYMPPGWVGKPHPSPRRQILFCLSGGMRITSSTGEVRTLAAGDAWLMGDTTGEGHKSEVTSKEGTKVVIIQLE